MSGWLLQTLKCSSKSQWGNLASVPARAAKPIQFAESYNESHKSCREDLGPNSRHYMPANLPGKQANSFQTWAMKSLTKGQRNRNGEGSVICTALFNIYSLRTARRLGTKAAMLVYKEKENIGCLWLRTFAYH